MFGRTTAVDNLPQEHRLGDGLVVHSAPDVLQTSDGLVEIVLFASSGLARFGQQEIVLCPGMKNSRIANKALSDILNYYKTVLGLARQGHVVDCGGVSGLQGAGPLGFPGLYYVAASLERHFPRELDDHLVGVFVTEVELEAVMHFGPTRVSAILGMLNRWYPFAFWTTAKRDPKLVAEINRKSVLSVMPGVQLTASSVFTDNDKISLVVSEEDRKHLVEAFEELPPKTAHFLKLQMSRDSDGCMCWVPGQDKPYAITPPGSTGKNINGAFLAVVPDQQEDSALTVEDGCSLLLTDGAAATLQEGFQKSTQITLDFPTGYIKTFQLRFCS